MVDEVLGSVMVFKYLEYPSKLIKRLICLHNYIIWLVPSRMDTLALAKLLLNSITHDPQIDCPCEKNEKNVVRTESIRRITCTSPVNNTIAFQASSVVSLSKDIVPNFANLHCQVTQIHNFSFWSASRDRKRNPCSSNQKIQSYSSPSGNPICQQNPKHSTASVLGHFHMFLSSSLSPTLHGNISQTLAGRKNLITIMQPILRVSDAFDLST